MRQKWTAISVFFTLIVSAFFSILLGAVASSLLRVFIKPAGFDGAPIHDPFMWAVSAVLFVGQSLWTLREPISSLILGLDIQVETGKPRYAAGEALSGKIRIKESKSTVRARALTATLICEEWVDVSCGSGKSSRSEYKNMVVFRKELVAGGEKEYPAGEQSFEFQIPQDAPPTVLPYKSDAADENVRGAGARWYVEAKLNIPNAPDITARKYIFVE